MKNLLFRKLQIVKQSVHVRGQIRNCGTHETKQPFASPFSNYGIIGIYARACNSLAEVPLRQEMTRPDSNSVVLLAVEELNLALNIEAVERVVRSVEIAPLPEPLRGILGVINMQGKIIPVFDLRARFGLPARDVRACDYLVIARMHSRTVALLVDSVAGVILGTEMQLTEISEILPHLECISGVIKIEDNLVFVHDLERFLSIKDYESLQLALSH